MKNNSLVGAYNLVSWGNLHESGKVTYTLGPDAKGMISYSPDGYVFVHIMANNRANHSINDLFGGELGEIENSATTHISYSGTYVIRGTEVIHYVLISSFPNWAPSEQRRHWNFENGKLLLSAHGVQVGNETIDAHLVWRKAKLRVDT